MDPSTVPKEPKLCQICDQNPSKYLCPRCGLPYCSLQCYKNVDKHLQCSESFYRECVEEHVRNEEVQNPENSKKMKEILHRFHEKYNQEGEEEGAEEEFDGELDSDDDEPLDKRLDGVDLNDSEEVWKHLTEDERKEFQNLVKNFDEAGDIIPEWVPWWNDEPEKKLVTEVSESTSTESATDNLFKLSKRQPSILNTIPKMSDLTKIKPNEHVAKGLVNVIGAYVWVARLFNGDVLDPEKVVEVAGAIICLSSYLSKSGLFKNIEHAVADVPMNACRLPELSDGGTAIQNGLHRDVWRIVKGPANLNPVKAKGYLLSALTECYTIFRKALKVVKNKEVSSSPEGKSSNSNEEFSRLFPSPPPVVSADVKILNNSKRRLLYLLSFANEFFDNYVDVYSTPTA